MRRPVLLILLAAVALGGCAETAPEELGGATEAVFVAACTANPDGDTVRAGEEHLCRCAYDRITRDLDYAGFEDLDRALRDDPETVDPAITRIVVECAADAVRPDAPPSTTSTTTSSTTSTTTSTTRPSTTSTTRPSTSSTTRPSASTTSSSG